MLYVIREEIVLRGLGEFKKGFINGRDLISGLFSQISQLFIRVLLEDRIENDIFQVKRMLKESFYRDTVSKRRQVIWKYVKEVYVLFY